MKRRKLLQGSMLLPAALAAPESMAAAQAAKAAATPFFTPAELTFIDELAETIIPADAHSGGAKAAGVARFIEKVLRETPDADQRRLWKDGLRLVDVMSQRQCGKPFVKASPSERIAVLEVLTKNQTMRDLPEVRFFQDLKRLTVSGYYTSKIGILDELEYKGNKVWQEFSSACES